MARLACSSAFRIATAESVTEHGPAVYSSGVRNPSLIRLVRLAVATASTSSTICSWSKCAASASTSAWSMLPGREVSRSV
jgi:hypothetical protein